MKFASRMCLLLVLILSVFVPFAAAQTPQENAAFDMADGAMTAVWSAKSYMAETKTAAQEWKGSALGGRYDAVNAPGGYTYATFALGDSYYNYGNTKYSEANDPHVAGMYFEALTYASYAVGMERWVLQDYAGAMEAWNSSSIVADSQSSVAGYSEAQVKYNSARDAYEEAWEKYYNSIN